MSKSPSRYHPAWWVPGAHLQTLWGKLFRRQPMHPTRVERWETPDGDFLDIHRIPRTPEMSRSTPHVILLHGLEGTVRSHYAQGLLAEMARRGWSADLLIFRSCGDELNRARRFYHSGETSDLELAIERITAEHPDAPLALVGVSLGGNVLLKYLGERGDDVPRSLRAAAAVSVPFDLGRGADHIRHGFSRVYEHYFLDSLKRKALEKQRHYPDLVDPDRMAAVRTLREFDDTLTAPLHGFADASDYYMKSSSLHFLEGIRIPTLLLSAQDDPFLPADVLQQARTVASRNPQLTLDFPARGGHAGFVGGRNPFRPVYYLERRVGEFLAATITAPRRAPHGAAHDHRSTR